jgi:O-antigen/teichoic acid export membrane protein
VKIHNLLIRGATLASRFILVIFIAKFLSAEELGIYSLFAASISYALFFVGMDFYTFSSREILSVDKSNWFGIVKNQFSFYFAFYILSFPLTYLLFYFGFLSQEYIVWFYLILVAEHLSQESMRLLVVLDKAFKANLSLFIRSGIWVYIAVVVMFFDIDLRQVSVILILWLIGSSASVILIIPDLIELRRSAIGSRNIDLGWMWKGVKVAVPLLVGTLALRSLYIVDRYSLSYFSDYSAVGIYSFYSSFANALLAFVDAVVVMQLYPKIVSAVKQSDAVNLRVYKKKFITSVAFLSLVLFITLPVGVYILLKWMNKPEYFSYFSVLAVLMAACVIYCFALLPHYELYARNEDRKIIFSSLWAAAVGAIAMPAGAYYYGVYGVAAGQLLAVIFLCIYKVILLRKSKLNV